MKRGIFFAGLLLLAAALHAQEQQQGLRIPAAPDLRGPIVSDQFNVRTGGDGVSVTDFTYKPFPPSTLDGRGRWIWIDPAGYPDQQATQTNWLGTRKEGSPFVVNFKKVLDIGDEVAYANIKLSADVQYRLFINGRLSGRGPANTGSDYADRLFPRHWFYDQFDTRHSFTKGVNVIAIEVSTLNRTASFATMGRGGLIMVARIHLRSGKTLSVSTDSSWVCAPSAAYRPDMVVDASKETAGWISSPVCDKTWSHAVVLPDSISSIWKLRPSELPQMMEKRIFPVKITREGPNGDTVTAQYPLIIKASRTPQKIRLEFSDLYTGYLGFRVSGKAGTKLDLVTGETAGSRAQGMGYILSDGAQTYESPHLMDGKYVDVTVINPDGDLTIDDIVINYSSFPVSYLGHFSCSDPFLNALWKNIRWITQMNMQTYHMDSPLHQEPVSDAGDYLIESLVNYYTFFSPLLVKQDLRKIALILEKTDYKMFHTSYMLLWVQMLVHYYEYTGDKELLGELAPDVYKLLARFHSYVGAPGIVTDAPNYMFMDWGSIYGIGFHHPPASLGQGYMSAFYYEGLMDGKRIAGYLGDAPRTAQFSLEAETLRKAFVSSLYDRDRQLFKNGIAAITAVQPNSWMPPDTAIGLDLPYVNTLAVLYGLAPAGARDSIIRYVLAQKEVTPSPYFMYFVFDAMAEAGDFNRYGMEQLRRWAMLSQHPVGLREGWAMGDYSHAWGGSPAYELSSKVLGVNPAKPGFKEVLIAPNPGDLDSASGVVPTPGGAVRVHWKHTSKDFMISVRNPVNMPVIFVLPRYKGPLTRNGKRIQGLPDGPDKVMIRTGGGNNMIEIADSLPNVAFQTDDKELQALFDTAERQCLSNIQHFGKYEVLVEGGGYSNVWLETQPMGGEMYAKRDLRIAMDNQMIFIDQQRSDGRLPGMVSFRNNSIIAHYGWLQGFCFPEPALNVYYWVGKDPVYLKKLYASLAKFDKYLWKTRDSDGDGCLEDWCVYDTGDDNSVYLDGAPSEWPYDYPPTQDLVRKLHVRLQGTDDVSKLSVPIESMDVMSYSYSCRDVLARISEILKNGEASYWRRKADDVRARIKSYLWDPARNACYDRDPANKTMDVLLQNNIRCMYYHSFDQQMADAFIKRHLFDPKGFWTPTPLPSIAVSDPDFRNNAGNDWSGQPEGLTFQRAISALENYGHYAEVRLIGDKLIATLKKNFRFTEQYDPFTGKAGNTGDGYGPTLLSLLEYVSRMYGIDYQKDKVYWSGLTSEGGVTAYDQVIHDRRYSLQVKNGMMYGFIDRKPVFTCSANIRCVTDVDGKLSAVVGIDSVAHDVKLNFAGGREKTVVHVAPDEVYTSDNENRMYKSSAAPFTMP